MPSLALSSPSCAAIHLPHAGSSAAVARRALAQALAKAGTSPEAIDDALIVVSELVTNGFLHAQATPNSSIEVEWCTDGTSLRLSVHDGGQAAPGAVVLSTPEATGGRGLFIVQALCTSLEVQQYGGTRMIAIMHLN